ncbi:MAG: hypothetical protein HOA75_09195 [Deltaproteobacteria bacterium]|nr:hypothetical protein [Deltaproteobacteria bacterium]
MQTAFAAAVCPRSRQINPCNFNSSFLHLAAFHLATPPLEEHGVPEAWPVPEKSGTRYKRA